MTTETIILNKERNVSLTAYLQPVGGEFTHVSKRPAMIVIPGGAYEFCSDREADPVAFPYLASGFNVFILRYSVGKFKEWPQPLDDYEEAMTHIRKNAQKYNVYEDRIAVIGFSAGGHLAAAAATMSKNRPNAAVLGYALTGEDVVSCSFTAPDTIASVDEKTCPCFVFATRNDNVVPVINSIKMMEALTKFGISYEGHIYAYGPHGFSTAKACEEQFPFARRCGRIGDWVEDSIEWLGEIFGVYKEDGLSDPECPPRDNADFDDMLSGECTINRIMSVDAGRQFLNTLSQQIDEKLSLDPLPAGIENRFVTVKNLKFTDVLRLANVPENLASECLKTLSLIPNKP